MATRIKDGQKYAIKTIEKKKIMEKSRSILSIAKEIQILRRMNHPNIIKLYEVYENELYIHLVLEWLKGGDLLNHLLDKGAYSEKDACILIRHVLEALEYCHNKNIIHRDMKPENLIIMYDLSKLLV